MREREHVGLKLKLLLEAKKICAWCKVDLDLPGGTTKGEPTTHGICPGCAKALWAQWMADKAKEREKEQHKPQEEAARDLRFENDLKDKLRAIAEKTKGMDENAVLQEINGIANANGFKVTSEKAIGAKFSIRVKLTPAVPNSDTEITFNFIPESSNYILVYSHSVVGEQDKVKRWARPLAKPITEIKAKVKIPSQPRFDPVDPGFFGKLATGILVWMKHAPSSNEEAAFDTLHDLLHEVFGFFHDDETKPAGIWHQVWGNHITLTGLRTDIRIFRSLYGEFAVEVQADGAPPDESVWYSY